MDFDEFKEILPASNRNVNDEEQSQQLDDLSSEDDKVVKVYALSLKLDKLKAIVDFPRYYLANYFALPNHFFKSATFTFVQADYLVDFFASHMAAK